MNELNELNEIAYYLSIGMEQGISARLQAREPLMAQAALMTQEIINWMARGKLGRDYPRCLNAIDEANKSTHEEK